ncbi:DUF1918 domain-containing protein [Limosilactobacillus fermentum]|nr:DUF1918 domain-containing protein [Limosilactobacillus fermentum]
MINPLHWKRGREKLVFPGPDAILNIKPLA